MSESVIETVGLSHYFGTRCALDGVSLTVPRGSVFALLGRNGSGKSTLIQIVMGLLTPTRGTASVFGQPSTQLSPATVGRIGYTPEGHPLPTSLRVRDVHAYHRAFFPAWDETTYRAVIEPFGFTATQRVGQLSRGQRAGLAIALTLAAAPELLVMDDPALGLDPVARRTLLEAMLLTTRRAGNTVFFTSHQLDDVERVADHVGVLDRSVLRVCCRMDTFLREVRRYVIDAAAPFDEKLTHLPNVLQSRREGHRLLLTVVHPDPDTATTLSRLAGGAAVEEESLTLADAVVGYLDPRRHTVSLLDQTRSSSFPEVA